MEVDREYFECECTSDEHRLVFTLDPDEPQIWACVFLGHGRTFWQRLWTGIKYILNIQCRYGHFNDTMLKLSDADRFIQLMERYKACAVNPPRNNQADTP